MKKLVLLITHDGSDSSALCEILDQNSRIQVINKNFIYNHPDIIDEATGSKHKLNNFSAVWLNELKYNYCFCNKSLYPFCKFIYFVREAKPTLDLIVNESNADSMVRYYCYRLRRIYEMRLATPESLLLTWEDVYVKDGLKKLEHFLGLKENLIPKSVLIPKSNYYVTSKMLEICDRAFNLYLTK